MLGWPLGAAADCDSSEGCLTTALDGLVGGFTGAAGNQLWGWVLGGSQSAGTDQIGPELDNIQSTLTTIENELGPDGSIVKQLEQLGCTGDSDWVANGAATTINTMYTWYQIFLSDLQDGTPVAFGVISYTNLDVNNLYGWANSVINGNVNLGVTGMTTAMTNLQNLTAPGLSSGAVYDCVKANTTMPAAGTLDDRPPYETATNMQNYLLNLNTQAMIMVTEAYHIYQYGKCISDNGGTVNNDGYIVNPPAACQSDSADDIVPNLCPAGDTADNCTKPTKIYGSLGSGFFLPAVYAEFKAGGAPLSTDSHLVVNGEGQMLVRSIETYNAAAGVSCPNPQVEPDCGPTVGQWNFKGPLVSYPLDPYGYGGGGTAGTWQFADASLFNALLNQGFNQTPTQTTSSVTPGEFLCKMDMVPTSSLSSCTQTQPTSNSSGGYNGGAGLENANKLVLFPQSLLLFNIENTYFVGPFVCFMDGYLGRTTSYQPFCTQQSFEDILLSELNISGCDKGVDAKTQPGLVSPIPYYPNWYEAYFCVTGGAPWNPPPGYLGTDNANQNPPGFWWPALPLDSITCDNGGSPLDASNLNPAGLPQLCREKDFQTWFTAIVPPGPTTTTAIADTTLDAAAPNTNDGAGLELQLSGRRHGANRVALLGFDPDQLQAFLKAGLLDNARLVLTRADTSVDRLGRSPSWRRKKVEKSWLVLQPLSAEFVEGNGNVAEKDRGTGSGATWNCAVDADIGNYAADCLQNWEWDWGRGWGASLDGGRDEAVVFQDDGYSGQVILDVTEAVRHGVHSWALQRASSSGLRAFVSREGAAALGDPSLAPTLILTHPVKQSVSLNKSRTNEELREGAGRYVGALNGPVGRRQSGHPR